MTEIPNVSERIPKKEWKKETEIRRESVSHFLSKWLSAPHDERACYHHITDLHFSGQNTKVMQKIGSGSALMIEVSVFYVDEGVQQIHVVFDSEETGHCIDVYLRNEALKDYLDNCSIEV